MGLIPFFGVGSLDTETERQIQQALDRRVAGRITIAIAHRLSTLTDADRLIVLDKGRVVESGLRVDLAGRESGAYARLHRTRMETYGIFPCDPTPPGRGEPQFVMGERRAGGRMGFAIADLRFAIGIRNLKSEI